jgi:hypothetical protein
VDEPYEIQVVKWIIHGHLANCSSFLDGNYDKCVFNYA